jgi:hypothetical protein
VICHEYRCIFIHQRKAAGTSICYAFDIPWAIDSVAWNFMDSGVRSNEHGQYPSYFHFSVVRNPYDRFISGWKYCKAAQDKSVLEVLQNLPTDDLSANRENDPNGRRSHDYVHITRPQYEIIFHEDGTFGVDFVIRFERLQADFNRVCNILGKPHVELFHANKQNRQPYHHYFDNEPEARRLLETHFKRDFELFDYEY